jgi:transposase
VIRLRKQLPLVISDEKNELTASMGQMLGELHSELLELDKKITFFDDKIKATFKADESCKRLPRSKALGR